MNIQPQSKSGIVNVIRYVYYSSSKFFIEKKIIKSDQGEAGLICSIHDYFTLSFCRTANQLLEKEQGGLETQIP